MDAMMQLQNDRERRIQERRLRIQERLQALREGEAAGPVREAVQKQSDPGKQQALESMRKIMALRSETVAAVQSVPATANAAENTRRLAEERRKQEMRTQMLAEAEQSARKNAAVAMHWADLFTVDVPQLYGSVNDALVVLRRSKDLWDEIQAQLAACDAIMQSKNELITQIKKDLKTKDNDFAKLLKQQSDDIDALLKHMAEQSKAMDEACRAETGEIEAAYVQERKTHLEQCQAEMQQLFERRSTLERDYVERYLGMVESYQKQLFDLQVSDAQDYNSLKIRLENDRQNLERHMEVMLATYQLNIEKLDYNYRVLVERDHENGATINQQKRKIARQRDILTNLKTRYHETDRKYHDENMKLTGEYKRVTEQFKDLQIKFKHFELSDTKKFNDVWQMKEAEVVALAKKVMAADKVLHEQQLGVSWRGPAKEVFWSPHTPEALAAEQQQQERGEGQEAGDDEVAAAQQAAQLELRRLRSDPCLKPAMDMITDEAGFLLDAKVRQQCEDLPVDEAGRVRLDALLAALGVNDAQGLDALVTALDPASDIELRAKGMTTTTAQRSRATARPVFVGPDDIVKRLRAFVEAETASLQGGGPKSKAVGPRLGVSRRVLEREREFWYKVANVVDARGARTWDALHTNLEKYHGMLQAREQALRSVESLGQQNVELRALLNQYLSSQINSELQIPPTKLI